jgi:hypothetical protein
MACVLLKMFHDMYRLPFLCREGGDDDEDNTVLAHRVDPAVASLPTSHSPLLLLRQQQWRLLIFYEGPRDG